MPRHRSIRLVITLGKNNRCHWCSDTPCHWKNNTSLLGQQKTRDCGRMQARRHHRSNTRKPRLLRPWHFVLLPVALMLPLHLANLADSTSPMDTAINANANAAANSTTSEASDSQTFHQNWLSPTATGAAKNGNLPKDYRQRNLTFLHM